MAAATQSMVHPNEAQLGRGLRWSMGVHAAALIFIVLQNLIFPSKPMTYVPTLRVDVVGLPDALKKDLQTLPKTSSGMAEALKKAEDAARKIKAPVVPEVKEKAAPDEMVLKPKKAAENDEKAKQEKLKGALARMKALSRIQNETTEKPAAEAVVVKGNKVSKGTSLSGDARESAVASYFDKVRDSLAAGWALPVWLARQKLSAQVEIHIDSRGRIARFAFTKGSGNSQFDEQVKRTLQESQPLPAPPEELAASVLADGILVGFPL